MTRLGNRIAANLLALTTLAVVAADNFYHAVFQGTSWCM